MYLHASDMIDKNRVFLGAEPEWEGSPCSIRQSMTSSVRQFSMTSSVRQFVTNLSGHCSMTSSIRQFLRQDQFK